MFMARDPQSTAAATMPIHVKNEPGEAHSNPYLSGGSSAASQFNQHSGHGFGTTPTSAPRPAHSNQQPRVPPQRLPNGLNSPQASRATAVSSRVNSDTPVKPSEPEPDPVDIASIRGLFGWATVDGVSVPYLLRDDKKFVAVRIVEMKLLARFPNTFPEELGDHEPLVSYYVTKNEIKLLDEINTVHCNYEYGQQLFTSKDLIVKLSEFEDFYNLVKKTFPQEVLEARKAGIPLAPPSELSASRSGWLQVNNTVSPYLRRGSIKYLILPIMKHAAGLLKEIEVESVCPTDEECGLINDMCKEAGLAFQFARQTKLVSLEDVKSHHKISLMELPTDSPMKYAQYHTDAQKKKAAEEEAQRSQLADSNVVHQQEPPPPVPGHQQRLQHHLQQQLQQQPGPQRMSLAVQQPTVPPTGQPTVSPVLPGQTNNTQAPIHGRNPPPYPGVSAQNRFTGYQANMTRPPGSDPRLVNQTNAMRYPGPTQAMIRQYAGQVNQGNRTSLQTIQQYYQQMMSSQQMRGTPPTTPSTNPTSTSLALTAQQTPVGANGTSTTSGIMTAGVPQRMSMATVPNAQGFTPQMMQMANQQRQFVPNTVSAAMSNMAGNIRNQAVMNQQQQFIQMHPGFPGFHPNLMMSSMPRPNNILQRPPFNPNQTHLQSMQMMTSSLGSSAIPQNSAMPQGQQVTGQQRPNVPSQVLPSTSPMINPAQAHPVMQQTNPAHAAQSTNPQMQNVYAGTRWAHAGQPVNLPMFTQGIPTASSAPPTNKATGSTPQPTSYVQQEPSGAPLSNVLTSQPNSASSISKANLHQHLLQRNYALSMPAVSQQGSVAQPGITTNSTVSATTYMPPVAQVTSAVSGPLVIASSVSTVSAPICVPPVGQVAPSTLSPCIPVPELANPEPVTSPAARPDIVTAALPQQASGVNQPEVATEALEVVKISKCVSGVRFEGKSISCLEYSNLQGKHALVEAVCKLYFPLCDINEFLFVLEQVLGVPTIACQPNEEKAFIHYYTLPVPVLKCNKMVKLEDLSKYYPQLSYMFSKSKPVGDNQLTNDNVVQENTAQANVDYDIQVNEDNDMQVSKDNSALNGQGNKGSDAHINGKNSAAEEDSEGSGIIFLEKTRNPKFGEKLTPEIALNSVVKSPEKVSAITPAMSNHINNFVAIPMFDVAPPAENLNVARPSGAAKRKHYSGSGLPQKQPKRLEDTVERLKHGQTSEGSSSEPGSGPIDTNGSEASTSSSSDPTVIILD